MAYKKFKTLILVSSLLAGSTPTLRAEDQRATAIIITSALTTAAGLYLVVCKKTNSKSGAVAKTISGLALMALGITGMIGSKEILGAFDAQARKARWNNGDFRASDFNPFK